MLPILDIFVQMARGWQRLSEQHITYLALACFVLVILGLLFVLFSEQTQYNRLAIQHETVQIASTLLEEFLREGTLNTQDIDRSILGFGLYAGGGVAIVRFGTAPTTFAQLPRDKVNPFFEVTDSRVVLFQPLASPRMLRPPGGPSARRRGNMMDMMAENRSSIYVEIERSFFSGGSNRFRWILLSVLGLVGFLMTAVVHLYNRNRKYRAKEAAQRQLILLGEAARTLAHEIRNPLGSIRIQSKLLERKLPEAGKEHFEIINQEVERLNLLSTRVGEFIRNPTGSPEKIDLAGYLRELTGRLDFTLELTIEGSEPQYVVFDKVRLPSVCENIIRNARESMQSARETTGNKKPVVEAVIETHSEFVVMNILDRGHGVPAAERERIFDPFYTTKPSGSGMGLATAKRLVEAAGGQITVSDRKGGGTRVQVMFKRSL